MDEARVKELSKLAMREDAHLAPSDVRALVTEVQQLRGALRSFLNLNWAPDSVPGPSFYIVESLGDARRAMQTAGILLDGRSPFESDTDGNLMVFVDWDGTRRHSVWLGGRAYSADRPELVPENYRDAFRAALASTPGQSPA